MAIKILMNGEFEIVINNLSETLEKDYIDEVFEYAKKLENIFNIYNKTSELSILNQNKELKVSRELLDVIKIGIEYSELTNGKYDISLGKKILARKQNIELPSINVSYRDIVIKGNLIIINNKDCLIDLGSIAKGFIVDKCVEYLINKGIESGYIDARGDIRVFGKDYYQSIEIQDPRNKEKILGTISLKNQSIATSGDYNQFYRNYDNCHIIGKTDLISVSVIADNLTKANAISTSLFVLDKIERKQFIKHLKGFCALLIDKNLCKEFINNFPKIIL